ncbi:hypothetical protein NDU88_002150 [Pleurodeles waltl]|uniref:Uncharacterized protein n=1 Tax=Pleurodeles waltl TaxID=8319 RepID=A0AAV7P8L9_PLEWA|nr:hypothetical protein NDU88_002150 [Pleurodeles waltl]
MTPSLPSRREVRYTVNLTISTRTGDAKVVMPQSLSVRQGVSFVFPTPQPLGEDLAGINTWTAPRSPLGPPLQMFEPREYSLEMPNGKSSGRTSGKPARLLLFSETLQHSHPAASAPDLQLADRLTLVVDPGQDNTMERILQEMNAITCTLATETKSICLDIASFHSRVTGVEQPVTAMEDHLNTVPDQDQELLFLHSKLNDLEDRSCRDNVFGFTEHIEGPNIQAFFQKILPTLTSLTFDSLLEFEMPHCLGLKRPDRATHP